MRALPTRRPAALVALVAAVTACSGQTSAPPRTEPPATHSQPTTQPTRPAYDGSLRLAWSIPLDAAMYARPVVAGHTAIAATENNTVYAADLSSGRLLWRRHLAAPARRAELPCGNIDPSGITGTPAYDAASGLVFVATETHRAKHTLYAIDMRTGGIRWHRDLDVLPDRDPLAEQQRGALLVAAGHVYVPFGGRYGDCGNYVGYVVGVPIAPGGPELHYAMPTAREGGIWAAGGAVLGPDGDIYAASGNGAEVGGRYDGSDSVVRLSTSLTRKAFFAPQTWRSDNEQDLDLGSMSPVVAGDSIVIAGKRGRVFLLRASLGGIGGDIAHLDGCAGYGSGVATGTTVVLPCTDGVRALRINGNRMRWSWRNHALQGSPIVGGGNVFAFDGADLVRAGIDNGKVHARIHVGDLTRFAAPVATAGMVLVGTRARLVAVQAGSH